MSDQGERDQAWLPVLTLLAGAAVGYWLMHWWLS